MKDNNNSIIDTDFAFFLNFSGHTWITATLRSVNRGGKKSSKSIHYILVV